MCVRQLTKLGLAAAFVATSGSLASSSLSGVTAQDGCAFEAGVRELYFGAADPSLGDEPWVSDGTSDGTRVIADIRGGGRGSEPGSFLHGDGAVYFAANDGKDAHGRELWLTDGTAAGTRLVADIHPAGSSDPRVHASVGTALLFTADDGSGRAIWLTDGTPEGTQMVTRPSQDYEADDDEDVISWVTQAESYVYFVASEASDGADVVWVTDGTKAGTRALFPMIPTPSAAAPVTPVPSPAPAQSGYGLPAPAASPAAAEGAWELSGIWGLRAIGPRVVFFAAHRRDEVGIHVSDGSPGGHQLLQVIRPSEDSTIETLTELDGRVLIAVGDVDRGPRLLATDGTREGTVDLARVRLAEPSHEGDRVAVLGASAYFFAESGKRRVTLWRTDGTPAGTRPVSRVDFSEEDFAPELKVSGETLYLIGYDRLWASDGTRKGTRFLRRFPQVDSGSLTGAAAGVAGHLYVVAPVPGTYNDFGIWESDGTRAGTRFLWPAAYRTALYRGADDVLIAYPGALVRVVPGAEPIYLWTGSSRPGPVLILGDTAQVTQACELGG